MNNRMKGFNKKGQNNRNNDKYFKGRYCSMCGKSSHNSSDGCWSMRNSRNEVVEAVPTYNHCDLCYEKLNKKLFHPSQLCFTARKMRENKKESQQ